MMTNQELMSIIDGIRAFPIGEIASDRFTLLCKAEVVSFLAQYQEQFQGIKEKNLNIESIIRSFLGELISLKTDEVIPDASSAERFLNLKSGFLKDSLAIKKIMKRHPESLEFYNKIFRYLKLFSPIQLERQI